VSKHGHAVAAIDPVSTIPAELIAEYARPGERTLEELTATEINQGSPSAAVAACIDGLPRYVTRESRVFGLLRKLDAAEISATLPTRAQIVERERQLDRFLKDSPRANAREVAIFGEELDRQLGITASFPSEPTLGELDPYDVALLGSHIQSVAHAYAEKASEVLAPQRDETVPPQRATVLESLMRALEARTIVAITGLTEEVLADTSGDTMLTPAAAEAAAAVTETRAEEALTRMYSDLSGSDRPPRPSGLKPDARNAAITWFKSTTGRRSRAATSKARIDEQLRKLESRWLHYTQGEETIEQYVDGKTFVFRTELTKSGPDPDVDVSVRDGKVRIVAMFGDKGRAGAHKLRGVGGAHTTLVRAFPLPPGSREEDVQASYKDGILEVRGPVVDHR
jgi:HSP20 family molecular chaperone IbpA